MGTPASPRRRKPPPKPPTWDQPKALELAEKGVLATDIASVVGVHRTTVSDYLRRVLPEFDALHSFKDRLGDSLMLSLARLSDLEDKLLILLNDGDVLATLDHNQKERLLGRVVIAKAINFDKLRLQEGKSTANLAHQLQVERVHKSLEWGPGGSVSMRSFPVEITSQTET